MSGWDRVDNATLHMGDVFDYQIVSCLKKKIHKRMVPNREEKIAFGIGDDLFELVKVIYRSNIDA